MRTNNKAGVGEHFVPFQVVTTYSSEDELDLVLEACERMSHPLNVVGLSNDASFQSKVLANTVDGTTYGGIHTRTTGAPQNHWFGDQRGAGIGTSEATSLEL